MRTRTTVAALAATTLLTGLLPSGSAGPAVAGPPSRCSWTLVDTPDFNGAVHSVDAVSTGDARFFSQVNAGQTKVMLDWQGSAATVSDAQLPAMPRLSPSTHHGLSFESAGNGWFPLTMAGPIPVMMRWRDGRWSPTPAAVTADPRNTYPEISATAPVSDDDAWAVGAVGGLGAGVTGALIQRWDGTEWRAVDHPAATRPNAHLFAVDAGSATDVWAVGNQRDANNVVVPMALHYDGTAWREVPMPAGQRGFLTSVSVSEAGDVWAAGNAGPTPIDFSSVVVHYDGHQWTSWTESTGLPPEVANGQLEEVVANAPDDVWAVGSFNAGTHEGILHWDGTRWELVMPHGAQPPGTEFNYLDIDATGRGDVWAVGSIRPIGGGWNLPEEALIAHLSCGRR